MSYQSTITKSGLMHLVRKWFCTSSREKQVPEELQQAINDCSTMEQLLDLLFATDWTSSEAIIKAFGKRIDELVAPENTPFFHV